MEASGKHPELQLLYSRSQIVGLHLEVLVSISIDAFEKCHFETIHELLRMLESLLKVQLNLSRSSSPVGTMLADF